mmetsp:Transcript_1140/g.7429  ORF Transcript_1140/g.7429 Transcript_1140/m.7429 type:complete len:95 (+) Transcript_1140:187-471(+)
MKAPENHLLHFGTSLVHTRKKGEPRDQLEGPRSGVKKPMADGSSLGRGVFRGWTRTDRGAVSTAMVRISFDRSPAPPCPPDAIASAGKPWSGAA